MLKRSTQYPNLEEIVSHFRKPKKTNNGYMVRCSAHEDENPSCHISVGDNGKILINCFAGCHPESVVERAGLTWSDMFAHDPVTYFVYTDENGFSLYRVCRTTDKTTGEKLVWMQKYLGGDDWGIGRGNMTGVRRVPYKLPLLIKSEVIAVVEGEQNAETLIELGIPATCGVGGAGNWREEYNSFFKGLEVYLFYDNDKAGRNDVYIRAINLLPVAKSLLLVELPLPYKPEQGNDVTDYVEAGHGYDDIVSIMNAAPVLTSVDEIRESLGLAEQQQPEAGEEVKIGKTGSVFIQRFSSIQAKQVKWLMADYFPFSKPVIIDGEGGSGKSTLAISIAAPVTQGGPMPLNLQSDLDGPAGVIILSAEDDPADTIKPRLVAAGADVDRVAVITAVKRKDEFIEDITVKDLDAIKVAVQEMGAKLVIIDPLMSYLPESSKTDSYKSQDIRRILKPLARLAQELEIVIIIIRHYVKAKVTNPHAKGMGSIDIVNFLRGSLSVWPDPDDKEHERCILAITKPNLTSKKTPSLVYSLAVKTIEVDGVICKNIPYAVWHGTSKYLARELAKGRIFDDEEENAVKVEEGKMKVLEEVMNWKGSELIKRSELHAMVRLGTDRVDTYAKMLVDEEKLIRLGEGKSYSPYRYLANVFRFSIGGGKQVIRSKTKRLTMYGIVCSRDPLTGKPTQWFFPDGYSGPERKEN